MEREPAAKLRGWVGLILLLGAAVLVWWGLDRAERRIDWLRVEAPRQAIAGQRLPMRVHLAPVPEPVFLRADLHWTTSRDARAQYLSTGGAKAVGKEGGTFDFDIMVPSAQGLRFVMGVIYLSRTGSWSDHLRAAGTKLIPVSSSPGDPAEKQLEPLSVQSLSDGPAVHSRPTALPRLLTSLLFLAGTVLAWKSRQPPSVSGGGTGSERRWWGALLVLLALACLWELLGLENWLGNRARAMARAENLYYTRVMIQKVVISVTSAATLGFLIFVWRARSSRRLLLLSFGLYLGISAVNLVSLHTIDKLAQLSWHGVSLVRALKLGGAALTLYGVCRARQAARHEAVK